MTATCLWLVSPPHPHHTPTSHTGRVAARPVSSNFLAAANKNAGLDLYNFHLATIGTTFSQDWCLISTFSDTAELWLYTRWSYAPSLCFVHPLSCAADSQHVCPKTKTKSSWAKRGPDNKNNLVFTCFPSILPSVHAILKIRFPFHTNTRKKDGCVHSVWVSTCLHLKNKKCVPETKRRGSYWHLCLIPILSHYFNSIFPIFNFQTRQYLQIYHSVHTDDNKKRSQSRSSAEAPDISALFFT